MIPLFPALNCEFLDVMLYKMIHFFFFWTHFTWPFPLLPLKAKCFLELYLLTPQAIGQNSNNFGSIISFASHENAIRENISILQIQVKELPIVIMIMSSLAKSQE